MEWLESIRKTIQYLEEHLTDTDADSDVSREVGISSFYLQKGFSIMTGYTIAEYVRNRRLYLAALEVIADREKVIDIAFKYGYDTPESFSKAFTRFHGVSPMQLKKDASKMHIFLPLKINITLRGGNKMDFIIDDQKAFKVVGVEKEFSMEDSHKQIPKFWDEFWEQYMTRLMRGEKPANRFEEAIIRYHVGMFGVCIDDLGDNGKFRYMIAGEYSDGDIPEGMVLYEFPDMQWAKFLCKGPMPGSLQSVNTKIFKEWLPGNPEYEIAMGANIEWYSEGDTQSVDYESAIWIPVNKK